MIAYLPYLILLLPLLAAVSIRVFLHPFPRISVAVSTFACLGSFVGSLGMLFNGSVSGEVVAPVLPWIEWAGFKANFGLMGDPLARGMATLVSGVALLVHIYSIGYLEKDPSRSRFLRSCRSSCFRCLGLFWRTIWFRCSFSGNLWD